MDIDPDAGGGVLGVVFRGRRYDTGDRLDYLKTVVTLAVERDDLSGPLLAWLKEFAGTERADRTLQRGRGSAGGARRGRARRSGSSR